MDDKSYFTLLVFDVGPKFINNPEPIVAPLGDEVEFDCSLDVKADYLRWKHNGKLLPFIYNDTAKSRLVFKMNNESQIGDYQCIAWYGASAIASNSARLSLAEIGPIPPKSYRSVTVSEGNNIGIKCRSPYSKPAAFIQYYKNNVSVEAHVSKSGTLLLTNVTSKDSGLYSCSITNPYVKENAIFLPSYDNILVSTDLKENPPQFSYLPESLYTVQIGANVTLECVGYGQPIPKYYWKRKNGTLPLNKHTIVPGGLLLINVNASDEDFYTCEIDNGIPPKLIHNFKVVVQEPAFVEKGPLNLLVKEGGKARMDCFIRGKPFPKVTWLLNGETVKNDSHVLINGSTIHIFVVEKRHAGMYQCMAENILGSSFGSSTLRVEPRQVTAKNSFGMRQFSFHNPRFRGSEMIPPTRPNVTRLTDNSVMVRWHVTPNKGLPILFFKVQHRELTKGKGSRWKTNNEDIPPHVGSYEVVNLTPDKYYRFRIAAVYSNMDNKLSPNSARFFLHGGKVKQTPAAPELIHTSAAGPESIRLVWEYHNNSKIPIEGFYVYYRSTSTAGDYIKATVEGEWIRTYVINYLNPDTAYDIKLQSFTIDAASDFSEILTQKTEKEPTVSPPSEKPTTKKTEDEENESSKSSNQLYVTLGAVLGGLGLLLMLCLGIFFCNKHRQTSTVSQEQINLNGHIPISNGHVGKSNGYLTSKMNITNNPLADTDEDKV
ncbi:conserved hypothetical protein [Pediculus humanus corporis]|uniref:Interference hedgehog n=1 Tax=Pediculus humanus subsp. corporis TaxID=121224 RepID=E0VM31_PEDHC|nr:uncharacterized protein Phum_PHUM299830 [Pediculus humanus corporis]EEB14437.1 conserved hypothetical protein [Pediculus humanus corporis]